MKGFLRDKFTDWLPFGMAPWRQFRERFISITKIISGDEALWRTMLCPYAIEGSALLRHCSSGDRFLLRELAKHTRLGAESLNRSFQPS